MYIFCSKALADALNIKKNELQKISVDDLYAWHQLSDDVLQKTGQDPWIKA